MPEAEVIVQPGQAFESGLTMADIHKDLPLYEQMIARGQALGPVLATNLIEMIRAQANSVEVLTAKLRSEERDYLDEIKERDRAEECADKLAAAVAKRFRVDVGEHSNLNCPWAEADSVLNGEYVTDSDEDREIARLRKRITELEGASS